MKIIKLNTNVQNPFYLPIHPHCLVESTCSKCGGRAFPNSDIPNAIINFGNRTLPCELHFTCFNYLNKEKQNCEHSWKEKIIIRASLELVAPCIRCPCCQYKTLKEAASFEICPVCFWEDDGQSDTDAAQVKNGPNQNLSLQAARENFFAFKACDRRFIDLVRAPKPEEL